MSPRSSSLRSLQDSSAAQSENLQREYEKCKLHQANSSGISIEEKMTETHIITETTNNSFKDALMKQVEEVDLSNEVWADLIEENFPENQWYKEPTVENIENKTLKAGPVIPVIPVSKEELADWAVPWRNTLIVKVLGKRVNYRMLENKLRREWMQHGTIKIADLADDYYLITLSSIDDYKHALFEGPWKVADHYLVVQRWRPYFSHTASVSQKIAVWIRIPKLPMEMCNDKFLTRLGATLGTMLKIDKLTSLHSRGKFARICVELDLEKPLASHFYTCGRKHILEYEGLHAICFRCGKYGHKKDSCHELLEVESAIPSASNYAPQKENAMQDAAITVDMRPEPTIEMIPQEVPVNASKAGEDVQSTEQEEQNMGPWNIPKYNLKKRNGVKGHVVPKNTDSSQMTTKANSIHEEKTVITKPAATQVVEKSPEDQKDAANAAPVEVVVVASKPHVKLKVRNPNGGKNPQMHSRGRGISKPGKGINKKDRNVLINDASNVKNKSKHIDTANHMAIDKGNIPPSSHQNVLEEQKKKEDDYIMDYMRIMYKTHGESLLSKFRSTGPIRETLGQVDDRDKLRAEALKNVATVRNRGGNSSGTGGTVCQMVDKINGNTVGVMSPKEVNEEVDPQNQQSC